MHKKEFISVGREIAQASKALVMVHGRGGSADDIISLAGHLSVDNFTLVAPQASNNTWYPYSFLSPVAANEPWLSSALDILKEMVDDLQVKGIRKENIFFLGFSQGACLTLEFVTRNAAKYGGVIAFTGGLIGEKLNTENYKGDFSGTPVFIGTSDPDPHVPVSRVNESEAILQSMHAVVTKKIYQNMGHTINNDEIAEANKILRQ